MSNFYTLGQKTSDVQAQVLGKIGHFQSLDLDDTGDSVRGVPTGVPLEAVWVQLTGATPLVKGTIAKWTSGFAGTKVSGVTGSTEVGAGMVDPWLTTTVAQNECFWLIRKGRVKGTSGASYSANVQLIPDSAGKFIVMTSDVAGVAARCGRSIEAATGADESKLIYLDFCC